MKKLCCVLLFLSSASCTSLDKSIRLGATMGSIGGAAATHAAHSASGENPKSQDVILGATIGLGVGLLTSYLTHKEVEKDREALRHKNIEIHFGDLPPSPFMVPFNKTKGGR